jgi:hypothetical protein
MSTSNKELSIIIVSYNTKSILLQNYQQIIKFSLKNFEIIIIDNNSHDKSYEAIKEHAAPNLTLIKNKTNLGFTKAVNQGIKKAQGQYILLLNPDTIPNQQAIQKLLSFSKKHPKSGLVGGKMIHFKTGKTNGTCVAQPTFLTGLFEFTNLKKIFKNNPHSRNFYYKNLKINKPLEVVGLSGGFLLFKKELVKQVGFLDENFFMYLEDVDFGIRVKQRGYKNYYIPSAQIIHDSGSSSKNSKYRINVTAWRNSRNYFFQKHFHGLQWQILKRAFKIDDTLIDLKHKLLRQPLT